MNTHEIKKKAILGVFIVVAMLTMPSVLAERHIGTDVILTVEQFSDTRMENGSSVKTISASDDVPQFMNIINSVDLKNWFYWITNPFGVPIPPIVICAVNISEPLSKNYTYSINIPLTYSLNASNQTWAVIESDKFFKNITLSGLLSGTERFDVDYDGNYTVTVYGNVSGGTCNTIVAFVVDRTSEFEKHKSSLAIIIVLSLVAIAGYTFYMGNKLDKKFKVLVYSLAVLFAYMALATGILVEREYIKVISINSNLDNIFAMSAYAATLIASIMIFLFIVNTILKLKEVKEHGKQI